MAQTAAASDDLASLKPAPNQVAGHRFDEGRVGSLVDESGKFYKPLQSGDRGDAEVAFYKQIFACPAVPPHILQFFPRFFGTADVPGPNIAASTDAPPSTKYLVMEDLTAVYQRPCIIDIKMGKRTWYDGARQSYIDKCLEKDSSTTSSELGYRIAGLQVFDPNSGSLWRADRKWCKLVTAKGMPAALSTFFSSDPAGERTLDKGIADMVLLGEDGLLAKLETLRNWFSEQATFQFYSASILVIYEGKAAASEDTWDPKVSLRMVDFAHVTRVQAIDTNFLEAIIAVEGALESLLKQ